VRGRKKIQIRFQGKRFLIHGGGGGGGPEVGLKAKKDGQPRGGLVLSGKKKRKASVGQRGGGEGGSSIPRKRVSYF